MRFLLAFILSFVSVFAIAQAPPMTIGGPQGITSKRILSEQWLSIPILTDTPAAPLTGSGWPGRGYIVHVAKANDTTVWHYTGGRWQRIGGAAENRFTQLITGGGFTRSATLNRFTIEASTYYINGQYYSSILQLLLGTPKTPNANGRIDVVALDASGPVVVAGTEALNPVSPAVGSNRIKLGFVYYKPFDSLPTISGNGIDAIFRKPGVDSIFFTTGDTTLSVKDSVGISTASNGLTHSAGNVKFGGNLTENTNINLSSRRLNIIGVNDTTRFFSNGRVSVGGSPDSTNMLNVNGNTRLAGVLYLKPSISNTSAIIINENANDGNIAIGGSQLSLNASIGTRNIIIGTTGSYNNFIGSQNTVIGRSAGSAITTAINNVFLGNNSGLSNTIGDNNTAIGNNSFLSNTSGFSNVAIGVDALNSNTTSGNSVAIGDSTLYNNNAGGSVGVGSKALFSNTSGTFNSAIGFNALYSNTTGNNNTANGRSSLFFNTTGFSNVAVGTRSMRNNTTGSNNVAVGDSVLIVNNSSGIVAIGSKALFSNTSGTGNTAVGFRSLYLNSAGTNNTAIGDSSGYNNTGSGNIFVGKRAGLFITTGSQNTIIGSSNLSGLSSSTSNVIHLVASSFPSGVVDTPLLGLTSRYAFIGGGANNTYINDYYFGGGNRVQFTNDANVSFFAPSAWPSKADTIGSNFTINAGRGTGTGTGGSIIFRTSPTTTAGATLQTLEERVRISHRGNLLVGTPTDDTSSIVNIVSTAKGFLQPRMTNIQRDAITTPATGLQIFSTTDSANYVYRGTGGGWQKIANEISGSATLDFPSTNNGNKSDLTITVTGASEGDVVSLGMPNSVNLNHSCFTAWVSATDTVTVRFSNYGTGALDPTSATFKVKVFK